MNDDNAAPGVWPPPPTDGTMFLETLPLDVLENFPSQSVLLLLVLNVVTLGLYGMVWLFRQAGRLHRLLPGPQALPALAGAGLAFVAGSVILDVAAPFTHSAALDRLSTALDWPAVLVLLFFTFYVRNRLNRLLDTRTKDPYWFSAGWTFLFGVYQKSRKAPVFRHGDIRLHAFPKA